VPSHSIVGNFNPFAMEVHPVVVVGPHFVVHRISVTVRRSRRRSFSKSR
jgi:hypothetical protein